MKQFLPKPTVLIVLAATLLGLTVAAVAQEAPSLEVWVTNSRSRWRWLLFARMWLTVSQWMPV